MDIQSTKSYLKSNKITYEQLSERSGIPLNTLKNIFSGRTPNPRIDTMQAIEEALELNRPMQFTEKEKALGVVTEYKEKLSEDEMELLEAYRAIKGEKGEKAAHAIKTMVELYLDGK